MSLYSKKLHIRKNGTVTDINLYTTEDEVGTPHLTLRDGSTFLYAKIDSGSGTDLRVRKNNTIYYVKQTTRLILPADCTMYMSKNYAKTYQTITTLPNDFNDIDDSKITITANMFDGCSNLHSIPMLRIWEPDINKNPEKVIKMLKDRLHIIDEKQKLLERKKQRH